MDSSTCLVLLQKQGYYVIWVHYNFWQTYKTNLENKCCNLSDLNDASEICDKFWVKLFNIDHSKKFKSTIIKTFLEKKTLWEHFNPCTLCHEKIKYGEIMILVKKYDICIASWYYCRIENWKLMVPRDKKKDQTQSLILKIKKEDLKYHVFPLWPYLKSEVREIAAKAWIKVFNKKDSMWLCFVWEKNIKDFIKNYCKMNSWDIYYFNGKDKTKIWKKHNWLWLYGFWENSWFNLKIKWKVTPLFVYEKDFKNNALILTEKDLTIVDGFYSNEFNLLSGGFKNVLVKYNSNSPPEECEVEIKGSILHVKFNNRMEWVVEGEIFLLFEWELVLGGGVIGNLKVII